MGGQSACCVDPLTRVLAGGCALGGELGGGDFETPVSPLLRKQLLPLYAGRQTACPHGDASSGSWSPAHEASPRIMGRLRSGILAAELEASCDFRLAGPGRGTPEVHKTTEGKLEACLAEPGGTRAEGAREPRAPSSRGGGALPGPPGGGGGDSAGAEGGVNVDLNQIRKDLPRTFPEQPSVQSCTAQVEVVLHACAAGDPELGYCQGMNCVAAVVVARLGPDWAAAASRFRGFVARLRGLWLAGFPLLYLGATAFGLLCRQHLPEVEAHLRKHGMTNEMLTTGILAGEWLSLFSRWLPFADLWDAFVLVEEEGLPGLLSLTAALLQAHASQLLEAPDFTSLFVLLKDLRCQPQRPELHTLLGCAAEMLPAARRAVDEAGQLGSVQPQIGLTRSGSRVVHAVSDLELVVLTEDAKSSLVQLAKGLHLHSMYSMCETVYETVGDALNLPQLGASRSNLSLQQQQQPAKRSRSAPFSLCGCRGGKGVRNDD